jgi:2'-5' RNA ligase
VSAPLHLTVTDRFERPREPSRRLFFAIWPDQGQQTAFAHAARKAVKASGGTPVPVSNIHLTLVFLGSVPERRIADLSALACRVAAAFPQDALPLQLEFERLEHWKKPQVLCAVPGEGAGSAAATARLAESLRGEMVAAGFTPDLKPFRAHVTLARKVQRGGCELDMHALLWPCSGFALVDSRTGTRGVLYSVVDSWPLYRSRETAEITQ